MTTPNSHAATATSHESARRRRFRIWLVVSQLGTIALLVPWLGVAMMSFMAFDAGVQAAAVAFVVGMWLYPLLALICIILAWVAFSKGRNRLAAILSGVPLVPPVILGLLLFILRTPVG